VARYPLSGALSATALRALSAPAPRVAYRSTGYYEAWRNRAQVQENGDFMGFKPENWKFNGSFRAMNCILSTNS
jgi:hypothetical protein